MIALASLIISIIWFFVGYLENSFKNNLKDRVQPRLFQMFDPPLQFDCICPFSPSRYAEFRILPHYDEYEMEDFVQGRYRQVDLDLCETRLIKVTRHLVKTRKGGTRIREVRTTVFDGLMVMLDTNKPFHGSTIVRQNSMIRKLTDLLDFTGLEKVELESSEFEKEFDVHSSDQIEARYLLTPAFMERLLHLNQQFGGWVQASFYREKLFLMISSERDRFEPSGLDVPVDFKRDFNQLRQEMYGIFQIIDILKLNEETRV